MQLPNKQISLIEIYFSLVLYTSGTINKGVSIKFHLNLDLIYPFIIPKLPIPIVWQFWIKIFLVFNHDVIFFYHYHQLYLNKVLQPIIKLLLLENFLFSVF